MYAVFESGSHQYRVSEGEMVRIDFHSELEPGSQIEFNQVLLLQSNTGTQIGQPYVSGARIIGEVVDHPTVKLTVQKFRRRKRYKRRNGHRQPFTAIRISQILLPGQEPAPAPAKNQEPAKTEEPAKS
jgi:large subunit ribosomal protein L21